MATHARQQYFADESSLSKEKREFSIAEEVQQKIDSIEEGAQVNKIETIKVNGSEVQPDENKAVDLTIPGVVDSLDSTSSTDALSAKQGKVLYDYIQDVSHIGHFLALWDASTGLPVTDPETSPYIYNTGDFYTISNVAPSGGTNYRPDGTQYVIGQASTTVETENVSVNDFYFYDGTTWRHMVNSGAGSIAVDGSLSTTSTNPVENRVITNALNGKADATDINTKTFYLSSGSDLTTAQAAYDWYSAGKNPIIDYQNGEYFFHGTMSGGILFLGSTITTGGQYTGTSSLFEKTLLFNVSNGTVTSIVDTIRNNSISYIDTITPTTAFTPTHDWQPATKKYVDDHAGTTYTAGANIQISAQNVISATDTTYTAGTGISIDANNVISNTQTSAEWGNITGTLSDQTDLQSALDEKADVEDVNTKTFTLPSSLSSQDALDVAQEAFDWYMDGKTPIIRRENNFNVYMCVGKNQSGLISPISYWLEFHNVRIGDGTVELGNYHMPSSAVDAIIRFTYDVNTNEVTQVESIYNQQDFLPTNSSVEVLYEPHHDWDPATKEYVDERNLKSFGAFPGSGVANLQALYDWLVSGNYAQVTYQNQVYIFGPTNVTTGDVESYVMRETDISSNESGVLDMKDTILTFAVSDGTVTGNYGASSTTTGQGHIIYVNSAAGQPSNPQASSFWYDTTNNKLKVYDGTNWNEVGAGDMKYSDFNWQTKTGTAITLDLASTITPTSDFTVNAPSAIKDGQTYILRVNNGATAYTMTLGTNVTNPYSEVLTLTANGIDQFVFLAIGGNLELQPSIGGGIDEYVESVNGVSGPVTLKTVNGTSIVGGGNIAVQATLSNITAAQIKTGTATAQRTVTAAALAGGLIRISEDANNILANGGKLWAGTQENYEALESYDETTVYLII